MNKYQEAAFLSNLIWNKKKEFGSKPWEILYHVNQVWALKTLVIPLLFFILFCFLVILNLGIFVWPLRKKSKHILHRAWV